ncbi:MAG: hypothetical protein ACTSQP_12210 [Promethearchaeota archaeon]
MEYKFLRFLGSLVCICGIFLILFGGIKNENNFRILSDLIQTFLLFSLVLFICLPDDDSLKIASYGGIIIMIYDFILETIAVYLDWWYPLGGTQFHPIIIIPIEMVISFFFIGTAFFIILEIPEKIRDSDNFLLKKIKFIFKNKKFDDLWRIIFVIINAIIGTNGDYSAGENIWKPGIYWQPIYTFFIWLSGGLIALILYKLLKKISKTRII